MSANFSNLTSQHQLQDQDPHYSMNSRHTFQSPDFPVNMMMYLNLPSTAVHEPDQLFSVSGSDFVDGSTFGERKEEMLFFAPSFSDNNDNNITTLDIQVYTKDLLHEQNCTDDLNLYHEGFSLSSGNQVLMPSDDDEINGSCENRYMNSGVSSKLDQYSSQSNNIKTTNCISFDTSQSAASNGGFNAGSMCNQKSDKNLKKEEMVVGDRRMYSPNYITAVQELLDEFVNVGRFLKPKKKQHYQSIVPFNHQNSSIVSPSGELSPSQNDLCNKMTKLLSLLDEADRKYNKYCRQMQSVVSSFENMVGLGAARSYTAHAHQTISRQFRHMVDAIKRQIQIVQQSLGEKGIIIPNVEGARLSRLRYVDQQVRQERAFQQFGMVRQPWRPQRGLPETAVSVLRAWLFEHFLHPYPKDSEKIMLARKAGLTRSQVANWFINARVRLWKPMIEEMYKEEVSNIGVDYYYDSSESPKAAKKLKSEPEDNGQVVLHDSLTSIVSNNGYLRMIPCESRNNIDSDQIEANDFAVKYSFGSSSSNHQEDEKMAFELNTSWHNEIVHFADQSNITTDNNQSMNSNPVVDNYNLSVLGGTVRGDHVSLASMMVKADYYCMDPINQQERFYYPNMLSHFVV